MEKEQESKTTTRKEMRTIIRWMYYTKKYSKYRIQKETNCSKKTVTKWVNNEVQESRRTFK